MKLENQVCSLELAKRLKELGVKQESLFVWCRQLATRKWSLELNKEIEMIPLNFDTISAFTVAEFGELLPDWFKTYYTGERWDCDGGGYPWHFSAETEADARAHTLIYMIEQKLITF